MNAESEGSREREDLAAWHRSLSPRQCLYLAFELSESRDALARNQRLGRLIDRADLERLAEPGEDPDG